MYLLAADRSSFCTLYRGTKYFFQNYCEIRFCVRRYCDCKKKGGKEAIIKVFLKSLENEWFGVGNGWRF